MSDWHQILTDEVNRHGSIAAVARKLGYARTTISLVYHGRYPVPPDKIAVRVLEVFASNITCPHLRDDIPRTACDELRNAAMPTNSATRLRHWTACQTCPLYTGATKQRRAS